MPLYTELGIRIQLCCSRRARRVRSTYNRGSATADGASVTCLADSWPPAPPARGPRRQSSGSAPSPGADVAGGAGGWVLSGSLYCGWVLSGNLVAVELLEERLRVVRRVVPAWCNGTHGTHTHTPAVLTVLTHTPAVLTHTDIDTLTHASTRTITRTVRRRTRMGVLSVPTMGTMSTHGHAPYDLLGVAHVDRVDVLAQLRALSNEE